MDAQRKLFERYLRNECTVDELRSLISRFSVENDDAALKEIIWEKLNEEESDLDTGFDLDIKERDIYLSLSKKVKRRKPVKLWPAVSIAASVLLILSLGGYLLYRQSPADGPVKAVVAVNPVNSAILTLADGRKIDMDSSRQGLIATDGGLKIVNSTAGLSYIDGNKLKDLSAKNSLSTAKKHQYAITLSDGTKVWLNAMSSIRFPVSFGPSTRNVELTGEAYFEVKHDSKRPFHVHSGIQTVEVLGTRFVVNSYDDEPAMKTTLIAGSVKVYNETEKIYKLLVPGQQSSNDGNTITLANVDPMAALAWKNNLFQFSGADLKSVMQEFARWYDVEVTYEGNISQTDEFTGKLPRNASIETVIKVLKAYGINVRLEGKKVIVKGEN